MCGIAGILTSRLDLDLVPVVERMQLALGHRGPDGAGVDEVRLPNQLRIGIAHTRLAILDLTPAGQQPMSDPASGSKIVYNGEIYNHAELRQLINPRGWTSTCDTETLLAGWLEREDRLLPNLRGMFAFGLYDARRNRFWLVRDRLGIKPLYASQLRDGSWLFASEVRAILASGLVDRRLDRNAVATYLAFGSSIAPRTMIDGVQSLLPGECWSFDLNQPETLVPTRSRYWQLPFGPASKQRVTSRSEALETIRPVLRDAVKLRMLSDVPVGVFLSGGVDSSALVATLATYGSRITTLSVAFEERSHDESIYARMVAERFGTEHVELLLRSDQVLRDFNGALAAYDQPSIDGLNSYFVSQTARAAGVPVALSGIGGDELFAGYPYFRYVARAERQVWKHAGRFVRVAAAVPAARRSRRIGKLAVLLDPYASRLDRYLAYRTILSKEQRAQLLAHPKEMILPAEVRGELDHAVDDVDPVNAHSLLELSLYTANTLLRDADQMSMAHALEVRVPLLDHQLVETMARVPGELKLLPGQASPVKGLLVDALERPLPEEAVQRRKMGFVLPWDQWLRRELRRTAADTFTDRHAAEAAGLDAAQVQQFWHRFLARRRGGGGEVLALLNLLRWALRHVSS